VAQGLSDLNPRLTYATAASAKNAEVLLAAEQPHGLLRGLQMMTSEQTR